MKRRKRQISYFICVLLLIVGLGLDNQVEEYLSFSRVKENKVHTVDRNEPAQMILFLCAEDINGMQRICADARTEAEQWNRCVQRHSLLFCALKQNVNIKMNSSTLTFTNLNFDKLRGLQLIDYIHKKDGDKPVLTQIV